MKTRLSKMRPRQRILKFLHTYTNTIHCLLNSQRSVWLETQSVTFDIVSRCFENKNNNCCEIFFFKNAICLLITNLQIHFWLLCGLDILEAGGPDYGFVNIKQMAFLQIFVSQKLLFFYFQNIWIQCRMWQIVGTVKQIFASTSYSM